MRVREFGTVSVWCRGPGDSDWGGGGRGEGESFLEFFFRNEAPRIMRGTKEVEEE